MKKSLNFPRLMESAASMLLGLLLLWLGLSGAYLTYVTPRTLPYLYFAFAALTALSVYAFTRRHEPCHVRRYTPYLLFLLPLILLTVSVSQNGLWNRPLVAMADAAQDATLESEPYTMTAASYEGRVLHGYDPSARTLTVPDAETYWWLTEIYTDPTPFIGYTVQTMGQVLRDSQYFSTDCFSPTRKLMTCCVADLYTIGFKCQYNQAQALSEGAWVRVTGTLAMVSLEASQELRLIVKSVEPCDAPLDPYVYAY